jgi:ribosomal protein S12 methylthiotransferase accessory factor
MPNLDEAHIHKIANTLVDDRVGILSRVRHLPRDKGAPDFSYASAQTCVLNVLNPDLQRTVFIGTGVATEQSRALAKAMGEAVERYCSMYIPSENIGISSFATAPFPCVNPDDFVLFSPTQYQETDFPYQPFTRDTRIGWSPALDLTSKQTVFVPASMVYLSYQPLEDEPPITQQISTGLACHSNPKVAASKAICEVIERDAVAVTWLGMLRQPRIRLKTLSHSNKDLVSRLMRPGSSVTLLSLQTDHHIPVIFSIWQSQVQDAPAVVVAAASHLDPEEAVRKSLEELAQICCFSQVVKNNRAEFKPGIGWSNVTDMETHALLYFDRKNKHHLDFLLASTKEISFNDLPQTLQGSPEEELDTLIQKVVSAGYKPSLINLTTEDVEYLGLYVVRVLIPGFHPLFMGHRIRALGIGRVVKVRRSLGITTQFGEADLNRAPHPFC